MSTVSHDPTGPPKPSALYIRHHAHQKLPPEIFCHSESCGQACCSPSFGPAGRGNRRYKPCECVRTHPTPRGGTTPDDTPQAPAQTKSHIAFADKQWNSMFFNSPCCLGKGPDGCFGQHVASRPSRCPHEQYRNNTSQHVRIHRSLHGRSSVTGTVPGRMQGTSICVVSSHHINQDLSERRHGLTDRVPGLEAIGEPCTLRMIKIIQYQRPRVKA